MAIELHPHQLKALEKMHNGCVLAGGVGSGKSITAVAYFYEKVCGGSVAINGVGGIEDNVTGRDVYVVTTARKRDSLDWEQEFARVGISTSWDTSVHGIQLKVISWNQITEIANLEKCFVIFDEQRLVGSGAWVKAFLKIAKKNDWIMLSATPGDNWMDYCPLFIANGFYKNKTEFLREHVVFKRFSKFPQIDRYIGTGILERHRRSILVDMPVERHTKRHINHILVENDKTVFDKVWKDRWNIYEDRPIRDVAELFRVARKVVNTEPSRLEQVRVALRAHERLIIFYNFTYELEALRELCSEFEWGDRDVAEWNGQKHQEVPTSDKWIYLVQYTAGAEAWNCITTNALLMYSLNYSFKINDQTLGRIDRLNTPYTDLHYYILRTNSAIDNAIRRSLAAKKSFNEKEYLERGR